MSNELTVFKNEEFGEVRTLVIDGEPWFVGKDVAICLGYSNTSDALKKHVEDYDKGVAKCDTLGGSQDMSIINESGMYSLIMGSKLPSAKKFKHWVTSEVLPSIRKTGSYNMNNKNEKMDEYQLRAKKCKIEMDLMEVTSRVLNLNDSSKLLLANKIYENNGLDTSMLPQYTSSKGVLKPARELLKANNINLSVQKFNKLMIDKGFMEVKERPSSKDSRLMKKFKSLINTEYGENLVSDKNPKETQPMYYENRFSDLLKELGIK